MIDGYCHCGISKYRPVKDVLSAMVAAGVDRAVLCQHLGEYDNSYLEAVVAENPEVFAAICLVDPNAPAAMTSLRKWRRTDKFRGVRLLAEWLPDHESLWTAAVDMDLTLVVYAPQGIAIGESDLGRFLSNHASARVVVSHLGNPRIDARGAADHSLLRLAKYENVFVQLSGLSQFCEFPHEELEGLIRATVREFGASRVYWGSNYPVCGDVATYRRDLNYVLAGAWDLSTEQVEHITRVTAERLWFLG